MAAKDEKRWVVGALILWAVVMAGLIAVVFHFQRRSTAILNSLVVNDPAPARRALLHRIQADRLVNRALLCHEELTSETAVRRTSETVLVAAVFPLLEKAEALYVESLDDDSSQPGVLFHLAEVNSLMGRHARAALYMSRYWESLGEPGMARIFRAQAAGVDFATSIPLRAETPPSPSAKQH